MWYNEHTHAKEVLNVVYTVDEIRQRVAPVAKKYGLRAVYLFGSYARNEATESSDVDILIDRTGSTIKGMFDMGGLYQDLCAGIGKDVDLVTLQTLEQRSTQERTPWFVENVRAEMMKIYE